MSLCWAISTRELDPVRLLLVVTSMVSHRVNLFGPFGIGNCNAAGEELFVLCSTNQLSVMNTWVKKAKRKCGTWTHPGTGRCHLIDYIVMKSRE